MKKNFYYVRHIILLALIFLFSINGDCQQVKKESSVLPLDPMVRTGKLPNGFMYYIRHNEEPKNRVMMYLVNKVGSVLEDEDQRGLAHFMEHMSFNGTKHFPHNELVDYLQKAGVRFGADINAYTSFDETVYELPIPSDKPELLQGGLEIMRDWAHEALLDPEEIDKERGVVLEEKRLGKGAGERMQRKYWPVILNDSRYAVRVPIGLDTVLDNFKRPVIARFYNDWYRPDLQALIIVGDINVDQIEASIKQQFASLKNPVHERVRTKYTVPLTGKNQFMAVTDKEMTTTEAEILIKHKAPEQRTAEDYRSALVQGLFDRMLSERYAELLRQADPPFIAGSAGISGFMGGLDLYDASVQTKPGELEKGLKAVWRETERLKRFGFTATELERAKTADLNAVESELKEKDKTNSGSYVKEYQAYFLRGEAAPGIEKEYQLTKNDLPEITLADVNSLAKTYITATNRDILILAPEKDKSSLPDEVTVNRWLKAIETEDLTPYKDEVSKMPLLSAVPVTGKIKSEEQNKDLNITTITLSNGVKVLLKPTDFKNDQIIFSSFAPGGTSLYSDADYQSAANAAGIVTAGGVGNYNTGELSKYLEGKQVSVKPYINERFQGISGGATPQDLETAMQLIYAYFTEPRKDSAIFEGAIARSKAGLTNRANDPASVFSDTVSAVMGSHNIRRTGPSLEKLEQINLDRAYKIYKERFTDAGNFTFTFVGSIDTNVIKPLLEKYLGSLPATNQHEQAKDLNIHAPSGKIERTVYKGSEPKATVYLVFSGKYDYSPENDVKMDAMKETLEIRLLQRLREDESGVYSPGVQESTTKLPQQRYSFLVHFGCAPQNVEKLIASTLDEIGKLKTDGPLQENVDKWRAEDRTSFEPALKTNSFWLGYINGQLQNSQPIEQISGYNALVDRVNPEGLKEMAKKYLNGDNYIRLVLLPETSIANKQ
ncbi:zinc protease [Mucilaginibacter mallensis]|uniref:Zinc protease n=1 Tax=Mucilaginibacter mallensis TaxID=652787 RepID=A0A1H1ZP26_MUCMA|nr:M16 family metallopeptidase [Mucilaginibacter mallensis]SDT35369.1 zinc protease [Mucilaginibacter mallensis]